MEVILKQDVDKIGKAGDVVKVKDGFARNFLFPNNLALVATRQNLKCVQQQKEKQVAELQKEKKCAQELAEKLANFSCTISMQINEEEQLYGSVTTLDIAKALEDEGHSIDKKNILLDAPIKALGIYEVPVRLHPEVTTKIKVWVVKK